MKRLEKRAQELRLKTLDLVLEVGEGHLGGSFSEIEILISLYDKILKKEDKFILSKGHACHPLYLLLRERGYNPKISGHPDIDVANGIYCTTGSLGHGLPIGAGMALAKKMQNKKGDIYVLMGDGEAQEGTTWETLPLAVKHKLDNLTVIIDNNKLQALEETCNVTSINFKKVFDALGCYTAEINGHNFLEIISTLEQKPEGKPYIIIANTIKGKGVSYMENNPEWHGRRPTFERIMPAYNELK